MMRFVPLLLCALFFSGSALATDVVPAVGYFPVLPFDAPSDAEPQYVPLAANHPLDQPHPGIGRAIIVLHDQSRDASNALATLSALAGSDNNAVMIVAPQFLLPSDIARFADHLPDKGKDFANWSMDGWPQGDDSNAAPTARGISSFTVIDLLLMYLSDPQIFPDMRDVVIAGYGAGGNFTQRYAAFGVAAPRMAEQNIGLRYLVADASSYLYLTPNRPLGGTKGFGRADAVACPDYNAYPYGLDKLNSYARRVGANEAKTDYALRFITYLNAAAPDALPDSKCAALAEGRDDFARSGNYNLYLQSLYGEVATKTQNFMSPQKAGNDAVTLYGSSCGMSILFGDGICSPAADIN